MFIKSNHGREFDQNNFVVHGIANDFFATRTPQQNGIVERKNCTLEDMARTIMCASPKIQTSLRKRDIEQFHFLLVSLFLKLYCDKHAKKQRAFARVRAQEL